MRQKYHDAPTQYKSFLKTALIATNTIAQGDTRRGGLKWICEHGGEIYACKKRYVWPSAVAVVVSVVHFTKGPFVGTRFIDGQPVDRISAYLFHAGGDSDPAMLRQNEGIAFIGCDIKGQGFLFDDSDADSTPIAEYTRLVENDPTVRDIVMPYMSGEEINDSPTHTPSRWVINFGERELEACRKWPALLRIVEQKVLPERETKSSELANWPWWQFWRSRRQLYEALRGKAHAYALSRVNSWVSVTRVRTDVIYSEAVVLFALEEFAAFALLQSRVHEMWARFLSSTALELIRYSPSNCFETFPFPDKWQANDPLEMVGKACYKFRSELMVRNNAGLTATYNRFHDPNESDPQIVMLRELHGELDRAVLDSYGWNDIRTEHKFVLDYDIDEEESSDKKKPWRYRWPDETRDEVLARLLALNAERAREEEALGPTVKPNPEGRKQKPKAETPLLD